ncbi:hypothetical protein N7499_008942 [Penicillium canescens]|nr:hypothetical protein N7499_008942 [Penicillium canescens]KAJ6159272.1 hypothetical protein N7485_012098 [Penicillium canescens]
MRGYTWKNKITNKEETVYCPSSFQLWNGGHIADRQSSTFASMKGKTFKDVKEYAAAGTVLHETTHSEKVMGEDYRTESETRERSSAECQRSFLAHIAFLDVQITYQGKVWGAYGGPLCRELAMAFSEEIGYPEGNADTLVLFALGVYYSQCNWANPIKPGKYWTDTPDTICPTVNNRRRCVTFDWNA